MIDIRLLRDEPDAVKAALARRGVEPSEVDAVIAADVAHRAQLARAEAMRAEAKELSGQVGQAKKAGDEARASELSARSRQLRRGGACRGGGGRRALGVRADRAALPAQHPGRRRADGRRGRRQRGDPALVARAGPGPTGAGTPRPPAGAALGDRRSAPTCSTWSAVPGWPDRCSRSTAAPGPACCGR